MELKIAQTQNGSAVNLQSALLNRHGLITGATGTGKTVTLQVLAEHFSNIGVPVFLADIKGDLSGISQAGTLSEKMNARIDKLKITEPTWSAFPTMFWDVFGKQGHPIRTTISEMGPLLLSRLMGLNDTQSSVLQILFKVADDAQLLLIDTKDLHALVKTVQENLDKFKSDYGHISPASLGAIQRSLITLEERGAKSFFGEPAFNLLDLLQTDASGRGYIHVLAADQLLQNPLVYSTFLLWLLSELFETLPEVGDSEKPKLVFFFDEAHLLFKETPKVLIEKIEQVVRLIRSKGVGIFFVSQNPLDIPESVLGQLSHRIQHALRAFTPIDQKAVKVAAQTLRPNPAFSAEEAIVEMSIGEALISVLDINGSPTIVERAFILPPASQIGPITSEIRQKIIKESPVHGYYEKTVDRISAFEVLNENRVSTDDKKVVTKDAVLSSNPLHDILFGTVGPRGGRKPGVLEKAATSTARSMASSIGRELVRGLMGSLLGGKSKKRL
jgi:uncharacterized protein